ncbi:MAG: hybrid sensor histidine kinase/response regulator [Bacteroidales bacterium]|nr:hybrid sensor histidine kinase/response regulator [Bacteroidales bacterium]MEA4840937.1 hybrid sensor histidine kinase/response regulator [Bacteroidales bacterium]
MNVEINNPEYKILIVDDVLSNLLLLKVLLSKEKFQISTAMGGREALEKIEQDIPDLILLDVMMPDIDGFEVTRQLRSMPEPYSDISIIFLTALNGTPEVVKGFQIGANDFVSKPFSREELIIRVKHQISLIAAKRIILQQTEALRKSIFARDKMYSVIAHDLRSPMGSIKMMLNLLIMTTSSEAIGSEMYEMLSMANKTTEETFTLLDNLLKWTKSNTGRLNVVYQQSEMVSLAKGVIEVFSKIAELKHVTILLDAPESCDINADRDMIKSVLRNLLSNAIKFSKIGGKIFVHINDDVPQENGGVVVSVEDEGCGISEEAQKKLLNIETHFSTFGTNNEEGSGLGLLLCQDFVIKNGGRLWFTSKEGVGTTFNFSIPKH